MAFFKNKWVRFLGPLAILAIAAFLLRDKMPFLAEGYKEVLQANNTGLILCVLAVIASMAAMADVMRLLLSAGGEKVRFRDTLELTFIANSWSSTFPGGAAISTVYQFHTIRNWGVNVLIVSWFIVVSGALSTVWLIALGLVAIFFLGASFSVAPLVGTAVIMIALAGLVYWATTNPQKTEKVVSGSLRKINKLLRRDSEKNVQQVSEHILQLDTVHLGLGKFSLVSFLSLMNWILDILALWLCVWAVTGAVPGMERVGEVPGILGITLAFVTAKIVGTAQVTPAGIGPVEAAMTASLVAVGMPAASAFGTVFVYRILSFILITAIGWVVYFISVARGGTKVRVVAENSPNHRDDTNSTVELERP